MSESNVPEFKEITPPERGRTYIFPNGRVTFKNVKAVCVRPSGTHRLELEDGKKVIVKDNWLAVELDMDKWTF